MLCYDLKNEWNQLGFMAVERFIEFCHLSSWFYFYEEEKEVKNMSVGKIQTSKTQSWKRRATRTQASKIDYYSELRSWVQNALLEAERNQDSKKSAQFLNLLKEL
jgi:hypothetical protein